MSVLLTALGVYYLSKAQTPLVTGLSTILILAGWNFWQRAEIWRLEKEVFE